MTSAADTSDNHLNSSFDTLFDLLVMHDVKYDVLQTAIERHGIFTISAKGPELNSGFEEDVLQALCYLDAYARYNDPFGPKQWTLEQCIQEGGDLYGWPRYLVPDLVGIEKELRPVFVNIHQLLNRKEPLPHTSIALEVERSGVWKKVPGKGFVRYSADSQETVNALTGLSIDLLHERNPPPQDYLDWYQEEDPLYGLGWPEAHVPKFRTSDEERWVETFHRLEIRGALFRHDMITVGRLIFTGRANTGLVKTAIEKFGIYGHDAHGRMTKYRNEHDEVRALDNVLAGLNIIFNKNIELYDELFEGREFVTFGWPREHLPDFEALKNEPIPEATFPGEQSKAANKVTAITPITGSVWQTRPIDIEQETALSDRDERAYITVIAGLLWFIQGKITANKHPDYRGQTSLVENFERTLANLYRAKERNIDEKFALANKLIGLMRPPMTVASPQQPDEDEKK
jgi:hypothetical protein